MTMEGTVGRRSGGVEEHLSLQMLESFEKLGIATILGLSDRTLVEFVQSVELGKSWNHRRLEVETLGKGARWEAHFDWRSRV